MKNRLILIILFLFLFTLVGCSIDAPGSMPNDDNTTTDNGKQNNNSNDENNNKEEGNLDMKNPIENGLSNNEVYLYINNVEFILVLVENNATSSLYSKIKEEDLVLTLNEYGGFEKVGPLGFSLPTSNENINTTCGDVVLYQGSNICIYYSTNSWSFTRIGRIKNLNKDALIKALGKDSAVVCFTLTKKA